jgi:hypothetical protein
MFRSHDRFGEALAFVFLLLASVAGSATGIKLLRVGGYETLNPIFILLILLVAALIAAFLTKILTPKVSGYTGRSTDLRRAALDRMPNRYHESTDPRDLRRSGQPRVGQSAGTFQASPAGPWSSEPTPPWPPAAGDSTVPAANGVREGHGPAAPGQPPHKAEHLVPDRPPSTVAVSTWWNHTTARGTEADRADPRPVDLPTADPPRSRRLSCPPVARIAQCPKCAKFRINVEHASVGFTFTCLGCSLRWCWRPDEPWPRVNPECPPPSNQTALSRPRAADHPSRRY